MNEYMREYWKSEKGKEAKKRGNAKYRKSEKGRSTRRRYAQSERGKEKSRVGHKKYNQSEKGKAVHDRAREKYSKSKKGKVYLAGWQRRTLRKYRNIVLVHYGGDPPKCSCCGESHREFLAIDHINGGGRKDKEIRGRGIVYYSSLIKDGFPPGLRVLCHNCNSSYGYYGYCPHQGIPTT